MKDVKELLDTLERLADKSDKIANDGSGDLISQASVDSLRIVLDKMTVEQKDLALGGTMIAFGIDSSLWNKMKMFQDLMMLSGEDFRGMKELAAVLDFTKEVISEFKRIQREHNEKENKPA